MPQPFGWAWAAEQLCCQPLLCQPQPALFSASEQAVEHCAATEICPPVQVYFKKLNCKKSGGVRKIGRLRGLFGKFGVDGVPVDY